MLTRITLVWAVLSLPAYAAQKQKVVVTSLTGSDPTMQTLATALSDSLLTELSRTGVVDPMGPGDVATMLGLERQKQLLGCEVESSSCLAEMTGALGAPWVLAGAVLRMGKTTRIDLKLIRTKDGKVAWRDGRTMPDESALFDTIAELVKGMVASNEFKGAVEGPAGVVAVSTSSAPPPRVAPWLVVGAGGVALVVGAIFTASASTSWQQLHDDSWRAATLWKGIESETNRYNTAVIVGPVLLGAGLAAVGGGLLWALLGKSEPAPVVSIVPIGQGVVIGGAF